MTQQIPLSSVDACDQCGQTHVAPNGATPCAGHNPCRRRATRGRYCTICTAQETLAPVAARPVNNPFERLAVLAGKLEAWMDVAADRLARQTSFGDGEGRLRAEVKAFNAIASRLGYLLALMTKLDLDERAIQLDRLQADQLRHLLEATMRDPELGLSEEQQAEWPRAFARAARLRVSGGEAITVDGEVA